jgi:hypothetical protein
LFWFVAAAVFGINAWVAAFAGEVLFSVCGILSTAAAIWAGVRSAGRDSENGPSN